MRRPWLLASGDFMPWGGMDRANFALASWLSRVGHEVHLVTHRVDPELVRGGVIVHPVPRPAGSHALGMPLLSRAASRGAEVLRSRGVRVVANGGNCAWAGLNWVHYVHAAYDPRLDGALATRLLAKAQRRYVLGREREAIRQARAVVCNSVRTQRDVVDRLGVSLEKAHVIYYGVDEAQFGAVHADERRAARADLGIGEGRLAALLVGALGDRRKGFDVLFEAWSELCGRQDWDVDVLVVGEGRERRAWQARADARGLSPRIRFLGYRHDMPRLLAAADVLVHPARYEAYGLAVHEAICRGVPAVVTRHAGVAERYPESLAPLLLAEVSASALITALTHWRADVGCFATAAEELGSQWRARTWDMMADDIGRLGDAFC